MSLYEDNILTDENALARFWAKIVPNMEDRDACWEWTAKKDKNGCAIFCMHCPQLEKLVARGKVKRSWKSFRAPRLMLILETDKPIPEGMYVLHHCDNEFCTNPRHIYLGTQKDNMADRKARGRFDTGPRGEDHPNAIFTAKQVRRICHLYFVKKMKLSEVARKMNTSTYNVGSIVRGQSWKHITKTHIPKGFKHKYDRCKIRNEKMYKQFKDGWSYAELSEEYGVGQPYVREVMRQKRKEHGDPPTPLGFKSTGRKK